MDGGFQGYFIILLYYCDSSYSLQEQSIKEYIKKFWN